MQELFGVFSDLVARFKDNEQAMSAFVFAAWRRTAGKPLSDRTEPLEFREKRLAIAVEDESWKRNLEHLSGDILYRLNASLGQGVVTFLEFRVGGSVSELSTDSSDKVDRERTKRPLARA